MNVDIAEIYSRLQLALGVGHSAHWQMFTFSTSPDGISAYVQCTECNVTANITQPHPAEANG